MELGEFKKIDISFDDLIEYMHKDKKGVKSIRLGYYLNLTEEIPEMWRKYHTTPPFAEIADFKDKNGCHKDIREYPIETILYLEVFGKSCFA